MLLDKPIPISYTLKKIWRELLVVTVVSNVIVFIDKNYNVNNYALPLTIAAIIGTAISLILAFRTAQAYDRWWEARKIWGAIVNDSRTYVRQILYFNIAADDGASNQKQKSSILRQIAWCYSLVEKLRTNGKFSHLSRYLSEEEFEEVKDQDNIPNALLAIHQKDLKNALDAGLISEYQQINIDNTIQRLTDHMGKCERIKGTVFPSMYRKYTRFLIYIFLIFLSLGMVDYLGYVESPVIITVAMAFFLLERTGIILQDPFENRPSDIDILNISRNIERVCLQMMGEKEVPDKIQPEKYYIM
jgi:putative membrane protein